MQSLVKTQAAIIVQRNISCMETVDPTITKLVRTFRIVRLFFPRSLKLNTSRLVQKFRMTMHIENAAYVLQVW
jgi:hypothetical protein